MTREWEAGRLARIAGRGLRANPHPAGGTRARRWMAGWLDTDARIALRRNGGKAVTLRMQMQAVIPGISRKTREGR